MRNKNLSDRLNDLMNKLSDISAEINDAKVTMATISRHMQKHNEKHIVKSGDELEFCSADLEFIYQKLLEVEENCKNVISEIGLNKELQCQQ